MDLRDEVEHSQDDTEAQEEEGGEEERQVQAEGVRGERDPAGADLDSLLVLGIRRSILWTFVVLVL